MGFFPKILYLIGSALCAQVASHSFFYSNQKLPLDARCTGIYLGFLVVFIFWLFKIKKKPNSVFSFSLLIPLVASILYYAFDGFSSIFGAFWVTNFTRFFSGLFFGQTLGILIFLILSHSFWGRLNKKIKIISWPEYILLSIIIFFIFSLAWFNVQLLFYFIAFVSIFGLLICFFFVNFAFLSAIFAKNIFSWSRKVILGIISFVILILEFSFLIGLRYFLKI